MLNLSRLAWSPFVIFYYFECYAMFLINHLYTYPSSFIEQINYYIIDHFRVPIEHFSFNILLLAKTKSIVILQNKSPEFNEFFYFTSHFL